MTKTNPFKEKPPRIQKHEIHRLSENGDGSVQWGAETDLSLDEVKTPGCFNLSGKHGFKKHDKVDVVCQQFESVVTYAWLVVKGLYSAAGIEVAQLGEAYEVAMGHMTPFERLGIKPSASKHEVDIAFRERSKRLHPDKGGDTEAMQELNKARDEVLLYLNVKAQAA